MLHVERHWWCSQCLVLKFCRSGAAGMLRKIGVAVFGLGLVSCKSVEPPATELLTTDEVCELLVAQSVHEATGAWEKRLYTLAWCGRDPQSPGITITLAPANGESAMTTEQAQQARLAIERATNQLVARKGWTRRYPTVTVSIFP